MRHQIVDTKLNALLLSLIFFFFSIICDYKDLFIIFASFGFERSEFVFQNEWYCLSELINVTGNA